ncbi:MAG TPA: hypothetical protein VIT88_05335, partial [Pyrinomonadaceae bacterium]
LLLLFGCLLFTSCNSTEKAFTRSENGSNANSNTQSLSPDHFTPPATWKRIDACGATFYAPPDVREEKVQGTDSCVRRYRTHDTTFDLDAVPFSTPGDSRKSEYSNKSDFTLRKTKVDGQDAEIISCFDDNVDAHPPGFNYCAVLFVPYITTQRSSFTIWTYSRTAEARAIATNVFSTVRFTQ